MWVLLGTFVWWLGFVGIGFGDQTFITKPPPQESMTNKQDLTHPHLSSLRTHHPILGVQNLFRASACPSSMILKGLRAKMLGKVWGGTRLPYSPD